MSEPVNIMGVIAYPNENGKRDCRFIDPNYNLLFTVPDGGSVILTDMDGTRRALACAYIDDYHVKVGSNVFHICEFAERMHESGTVYQPEHPNGNEKYGIYEIYQISDFASADYCFRPYAEAKGHIKLTNYRRVYAGMYPEKGRLDDLFMEHNRDTRPFGRKMRSMSVSDIVVVTRGGEKHAYYVDSVSYEEVKGFLEAERTAPQKNTTRPPKKKRSEPER